LGWTSRAERTRAPEWESQLYLPEGAGGAGAARPIPLVAVPYHAWGNREPGAMQVWVRRA
jgi:uncharacterized protein